MTGSEIPDQIREALPEDLQGAVVAGGGVVPVTKSCRLYGPPGTGKTTQLALRTAVRAEEGDVSPGDMTVITYRSSQADKVRKRLTSKWGVFNEAATRVTDPESPYHYWGTGHAVSSRVTGFLEPVDSEMSDISGMVSWEAKRQFCDEIGVTFHSPKPWVDSQWDVFYALYTYCKTNLLAVGEWDHVNNEQLRPLEEDLLARRKLDAFRSKWGGTSTGEEFSPLFKQVVDEWEWFKKKHDVHDFYEQLEAALDPKASLPPLDHLVVDEYHDAYPLLAAVCEKWIRASDVAIVAGDPDQTVNAYSGADPEIFERLGERVARDMPEILLDKSHRVPDEHYEMAARMLREERSVPDIETAGQGLIYPWSPEGISQDDDGWDLPPATAQGTPVWLWGTFGPDIMFLARTQMQVSGIGACLDRQGIVYRSQDDVAGNWDERLTIMRALDTLDGVGPSTVDNESETLNVTNGRSVTPSRTSKGLSPREARALIRHSHAQFFESETDGRDECLDMIAAANAQQEPVQVSEIAEYTTRKYWLRYGNGRGSIDELVGLGELDKRAMSTAWERYSDHDRDFTVDDLAAGTKLWTVHASKGAEASDVVLYDGITHRTKQDIGEHSDAAENEARTWYVGLTRSSDRLHIVRDGHDWVFDHLPDDLESGAVAAVKRDRVRSDGGETA